MAANVRRHWKLSFAPRFGDHPVNLEFLAAQLSGMAPGARTMRGVSVTTTARASSWTLMVGQSPTTSAELLASSLPKTLAFTGTSSHARASPLRRA